MSNAINFAQANSFLLRENKQHKKVLKNFKILLIPIALAENFKSCCKNQTLLFSACLISLVLAGRSRLHLVTGSVGLSIVLNIGGISTIGQIVVGLSGYFYVTS